MDNRFQNNFGEATEHPSREMLLLFVDGELPAREAAQMETHLEACWPCRVKTKKIQEAIADIIEFDEVITPRLVPPQNWINFNRQLRQLAGEIGTPSWSAKILGTLGRLFSTVRSLKVPGQFPKGMPVARTVAVVMILAVIGVLVVRFNQESVVSAGELLRNVTVAQAAKIRATAQPVVHQRFQVRVKDQASSREQSVSWEIWNDTQNSRVRQFVADTNDTVDKSTATSGQSSKTISSGVVDELTQVLASNHMDPQRPLSAVSYQSWHNTLQQQQDKVSRSKLVGGIDALTLHTIPAGPVKVGQIAEAVFVVRANNWQPAELLLTVTVESGKREYNLTEIASEVVNLAQVDPAIFAGEGVVLTPVPKTSPAASPTSSPVAKLNASTLPIESTPMKSVATDELEVETLRLLNQAGADLGEQITVNRTSDGILHVSGIVETEQRKTEINKSLGLIASNPAIQIEIRTVAEAVARQTPTKTTPAIVREVEITGNTIAAAPELRSYFARDGKDTDEAIRQYANRMVTLSGRGMDRLWAMKRLLNQFSAEQVRSFTPEARAKWISLIRAHARAYQQAIQSVQRNLQPIFFPTQSLATASNEAGIPDTNALARAVNELFDLGSSNDRVIRSAFTSSSGGAMTTVIKTPQFWQALKNAEALATQIANGH
jgi:putative zinc finger protein